MCSAATTLSDPGDHVAGCLDGGWRDDAKRRDGSLDCDLLRSTPRVVSLLQLAHPVTVNGGASSFTAMGARLGIDLDGVVVDFSGGWVALYNAEFGSDIAVEDVVTWGAPRDLTHFASMSMFWSWARTCGNGRSLFHVLQPYPGALSGLDNLVAAGHDIVIVTTKPSFAIADTHEWLVHHQVPAVEVHILDDKAAVSCDVYVDDAMHNLESYRLRRPGAQVVRWVQPWNEPMSGVADATTWDDVARISRGPT